MNTSSNVLLLFLIFTTASFASTTKRTPVPSLPTVVEVIFEKLKLEYPQLQQVIEDLILKPTRKSIERMYGCQVGVLGSISLEISRTGNEVSNVCHMFESGVNLPARYKVFNTSLDEFLHNLVLKSYMDVRVMITGEWEPFATISPLPNNTQNLSSAFKTAYKDIVKEANRLLNMVGKTAPTQNLDLMTFAAEVFEMGQIFLSQCSGLLADFVCATQEEFRSLTALHRNVFEILWAAKKRLQSDIRQCTGWMEREEQKMQSIIRRLNINEQPLRQFHIPRNFGLLEEHLPCTVNRLPLEVCLADSKEEVINMIKSYTSENAPNPGHKQAMVRGFTGVQTMRLNDIQSEAEKALGRTIKMVQYKPIKYDANRLFSDTREQYYYAILSTILHKASAKMDPKEAIHLQSMTYTYYQHFLNRTLSTVNLMDSVTVSLARPVLANEPRLDGSFLLQLCAHLNIISQAVQHSGIVSRSYIGTLFALHNDAEKFETTVALNSFWYSFPTQFDVIKRPTIKEYFERLACQILTLYDNDEGNKLEKHRFRDWLVSVFKRHRDLMHRWQTEPRTADAVFYYYFPIIWNKKQSQVL